MLNQNEPSQTHISPQELKDILELRAAQQSAASNSAAATTADVAEALDIPQQEVENLLTQIRSQNNPIATARRKRRIKRATISTLATLGLAFAFNFNFVPNGPDNPPLTVEMVSVGSPAGGPQLAGYSAHPHLVHVNVVYQYHPSSLKRLLFGPHWDQPWQSPSVSDDSGQHEFFPRLGGGQVGVTDGWFYRMGLNHYHMGYEFPLNSQSGHGAILTQDDAIDGNNFTVGIPLDQH